MVSLGKAKGLGANLREFPLFHMQVTQYTENRLSLSLFSPSRLNCIRASLAFPFVCGYIYVHEGPFKPKRK